MDSNSTSAGFCPNGGGAWVATQMWIAFLVTNILAHAATIRPSAGSNTGSTVRRVIATIFIPVTAGDSAFRALGRWLVWFYRGVPPPGFRQGLLRDDSLQAAATSGAVAICIPFQFAPLLAGRWELVEGDRMAVWLDDTTYFWGATATAQDFPKGLKPLGRFPRYIPFVLPPNVQLLSPKLEKTKIPPESSALSSIIAIVQIVLSIRDLYNNYRSSVVVKGLSSPYLVVIPYFLMSFVNFVACIFVGSYRRVSVLRMKDDIKENFNELYIVDCPREKCSGKKNSERHQVVLAIRNERPPDVLISRQDKNVDKLPGCNVPWLRLALSKIGISATGRSKVDVASQQSRMFEGFALLSIY